METWNKLLNLKGKGGGSRKRLNKDLTCIHAFAVDTDNRVMKVCGRLGTQCRGAILSFLKKLNMELPFDPVIPLLQKHPKNLETPIIKNICTPLFIAALFAIAIIWKQFKCLSVDECIKKLWYI
uniref:Uncharacterized protein n=1 Tax=Myotis myotis TaxID=51298 RepID=A0A7J7V485_MYOMY|nr:hypothetical protein mMyoMyo1_008533 [Myotis myotis]